MYLETGEEARGRKITFFITWNTILTYKSNSVCMCSFFVQHVVTCCYYTWMLMKNSWLIHPTPDGALGSSLILFVYECKHLHHHNLWGSVGVSLSYHRSFLQYPFTSFLTSVPLFFPFTAAVKLNSTLSQCQYLLTFTYIQFLHTVLYFYHHCLFTFKFTCSCLNGWPAGTKRSSIHIPPSLCAAPSSGETVNKSSHESSHFMK